MGTIRKPSISPPPPSPSPYESVISRTRIIYNRNITEKSFRAKTSSLSLSNKTKTLLEGGARAFSFLLPNLEIRGAEVEIIISSGGIAILFERLRLLFNPCCNLQNFIRVAREGKKGGGGKRGCFSPREMRISQWAGRVYVYFMCVIG